MYLAISILNDNTTNIPTMPMPDFSKIPPEQIKKMLQLQNAWERRHPSVMKLMADTVRQLNEAVIDSQHQKEHDINHPNPYQAVELLIAKKLRLLITVKAIVEETLGPSDRSFEPVDMSCRADRVPFGHVSVAYL